MALIKLRITIIEKKSFPRGHKWTKSCVQMMRVQSLKLPELFIRPSGCQSVHAIKKLNECVQNLPTQFSPLGRRFSIKISPPFRL